MTEENKVEVELHDEEINDIVEENLEEKSEPKEVYYEKVQHNR